MCECQQFLCKRLLKNSDADVRSAGRPPLPRLQSPTESMRFARASATVARSPCQSLLYRNYDTRFSSEIFNRVTTKHYDVTSDPVNYIPSCPLVLRGSPKGIVRFTLFVRSSRTGCGCGMVRATCAFVTFTDFSQTLRSPRAVDVRLPPEQPRFCTHICSLRFLRTWP